jgi:hypothetical protein
VLYFVARGRDTIVVKPTADLPAGRWPNPGGVPRRTQQLRQAALEHAPAALAAAVELLGSKDPETRLRAACAILDRAGCRPFPPSTVAKALIALAEGLASTPRQE